MSGNSISRSAPDTELTDAPLRQGEATLIVDSRDRLGESPFWSEGDGALYWTDIFGRRINRWSVAGGLARFAAAEEVGAFARAADGNFIAASASGFARLRLDGPQALLDPVAPCLAARPDLRMNDGRCDRSGRFWASSMAWTPAADARVGALWRLDRDGAARIVVEGFLIPNGIAFSADNRTMYLSDSHPTVARVWAFDLDADSGDLRNRRLFAAFAPGQGRPDGAAIDIDGCYWTAASDAGAVLRLTPAGKVDRMIAVPVRHPTMVTFGDDDLRTLYVTSQRRPAQGADALPDDAPDGGVFAIRVDVAGLPEPLYGARPE
jgi:sugar lactone lactonase YvrE